MDHSPRKCKVCGKYHCLAGCVAVEECLRLKNSNDQLLNCPKGDRSLAGWTKIILKEKD